MDCSTVEDDIIVDEVDSPEIVDDFELGQDEAVDIKDNEVNKKKLRRRIAHYKVSCLCYKLETIFLLKVKRGQNLLRRPWSTANDRKTSREIAIVTLKTQWDKHINIDVNIKTPSKLAYMLAYKGFIF